MQRYYDGVISQVMSIVFSCIHISTNLHKALQPVQQRLIQAQSGVLDFGFPRQCQPLGAFGVKGRLFCIELGAGLVKTGSHTRDLHRDSG